MIFYEEEEEEFLGFETQDIESVNNNKVKIIKGRFKKTKYGQWTYCCVNENFKKTKIEEEDDDDEELLVPMASPKYGDWNWVSDDNQKKTIEKQSKTRQIKWNRMIRDIELKTVKIEVKNLLNLCDVVDVLKNNRISKLKF